MASEELIRAVKSYEDYIERKGLDEAAVNAYVEACKTAILVENDLVYGLELTKRGKVLVSDMIRKATTANFKRLEEWAQEQQKEVNLINKMYELLLLEAPYILDSFKLYIERRRPRKERFYAPRRKTLIKISEAVQALEEDKLDELYLHLPPRVGKSQDVTEDLVWHIARDMEKSNLYVTYKEGLGGAFLDGVMEIMTDPTYAFGDVFPDAKIVDTDAKNNKLDLGRKKKYKSLSGKGLESGLNGEYDAYGWLVIDDPHEGIQDFLSQDIPKRKQTIFTNNVMSRKKENCKILGLGTLWDPRDIFSKREEFLENNPEAADIRYKIISIPALDPETDESNFDYDYGVGYTTVYFRRRRTEFEENGDLASWWAQYIQAPISRQGQVFNAEQMKYYSTLPEEEPLKIIAHCDIALGGGDYLSFPVIYCYEDDSMYCEDVVFDNSEKEITQPQVVSMIKKHKILNAHFESNQGGEGYKDDIVRMLAEDKQFNHGLPINISSSWAPATKRKAQRIFDRAGVIRQIYFKDPQHRHKQYRMFMQNLFAFRLDMGKKEHDDAADSLAGAIDFDINGSGIRPATISGSWL